MGPEPQKEAADPADRLRHRPPLQAQIRSLREGPPPKVTPCGEGHLFTGLLPSGFAGREQGAQGPVAIGTCAPRAVAALVRVVHVPAGSMVPSCGTYRDP